MSSTGPVGRGVPGVHFGGGGGRGAGMGCGWAGLGGIGRPRRWGSRVTGLGVEGGCDGRYYGWVVGEHLGGEAGDYVAVAVDEELLEVPEDSGLGVGGGVVLALEETVESFAEGGAGVSEGLWVGGDEGVVVGGWFVGREWRVLGQGGVDAERWAAGEVV